MSTRPWIAVLALIPLLACEVEPLPHDATTEAVRSLPTPSAPRVRRSWTSLSHEEQRRIVRAFNDLRNDTVAYSWPYDSQCDGTYERNAYDYFVEAHLLAFTGHGDAYDHMQMPHMGPQFLPWHREMMLRMESELGRVLGEPDFALPYWDWTDDPAEVFSASVLGTGGGLTGEVRGYLVDLGFQSNMYTDSAACLPSAGPLQCVFEEQSTICESRPLTRAVGRSPLARTLPTATEIEDAMLRLEYDVAPYDSANTDETISFRQYLEGYTLDDDPVCAVGGCQMHGQVHLWVGGDMGGGGSTPNDPVFFLHHANVDRLWAQWQDVYGAAEYPEAYAGDMFWWTNGGVPVQAAEVLDHRELGYVYDTQE